VSFVKISRKNVREYEILSSKSGLSSVVLLRGTCMVDTCTECSVFHRGPSVKNVPPHEASDRLQIFQAKFDELWRKYISLSGGEELFGLPITGSFSGDMDTWS